ncbi:hypothetical protein EYB53_000755 [Candidatus Chloroploca sp. M-50]|uniref:Sulfotransferase n=1 Tax=Candidatus Chloroploca mongolica TaxID=2528176 RepID=A0ABS4D460_9CHLR|nr:hypothetical protein [Candidatus Chloroploca mongolica]MBP1464225.1 hypothetical protein [Candidatus Chloroploca mongolica]
MNFVIFGQARTGSSLFVNLLQLHPQLQCDGELLGYNFWLSGPRYLRGRVHRWIRQFPEPYLLWAATRSAKLAYGFKLLYQHAAAPRRVLSFLYRRHWQIIHIQRRCLFDLALSRCATVNTGHSGEYSSSDRRHEKSIEFQSEQFMQQAGQCVRIRREELSVFGGLPHLTVTYEADLLGEEDRNRICSIIFDALHLAPHPVSTTRERTWERPYSEFVVNYAELKLLMQTNQGVELQAFWDQSFAAG